MAERYDFYVHDNRKITFNLIEPIMREDSGVTDFVFHIPKVLNELEVSDWQWWLVFVNAKKEKYSIALTLSDDPERPLEYNLATYTVDYAMSIKAGSVQFALEAINAGTGGAIDNEWHTLTYETKVKETLQGNQTEYAETESDIISALLEEVRTKMNQVIGGATPTPVASVSAMTDPSKLYLLTTDGNWYYHNGTQFVSGGAYGSGVVDPVPTQGSANAVQSGGVYSALADKVSKPLTSPNGTNGQLLRTLGNGQTEWTDYGLPTDEQTATAVSGWLDDHPEATTTVQDGAITEAKLAPALKLKTVKDYITPQMFGAVGDGTTDDTAAVINAFINSNYVFFPAGIYLCDWSAVNLTGKTVFGEGNGLTVIKQKNANVPFCVMGENGILKDITLVTYNNTVETSVIIMGVYDNVFNRFRNYLIDRVQIIANDNYTIGILYNIDKRGGTGGELTNSVITGCLDGIRIDLASDANNLGWFTRDFISNVFISAPKRIGFHINNKGIRYQLSHNIYSGIKVQLTLNNTTGIKLDYGGYVFDSPSVFKDANGDVTGINLYYSSIDSNPQNTAFNKVDVTFSPIVMNAFIEGDVVGFENNYVYKIFNLKTPTGANSNYGDMPVVFYSETGAINLFDVLKNHTVGETSERSGVEFTFNADETISMVGQATTGIGECYVTLHNGTAESIGLDKDKYYKFSCSHAGILLLSYDSGNVVTTLFYNTKTAIIKIPNNSVRILFRLGGSNGVTYNNQVKISITSPYITDQNVSFQKYAMSNRMLTEQIRNLEARIAQLET